MPRARKPHPSFARPLLASRERPNRHGSQLVVRALFLRHAVRDEIVGAFLQGDQLDTEKAQQLWSKHAWLEQKFDGPRADRASEAKFQELEPGQE